MSEQVTTSEERGAAARWQEWKARGAARDVRMEQRVRVLTIAMAVAMAAVLIAQFI